MQITLVSIHSFPSPQAVPLAAACLKAALTQATGLKTPVTVNLAETFLGRPHHELVQEIIKGNPDAVGFSMYVWNRAACLEMAGLLRRIKPGLPLFAGGPEASADAQGILADSELDFIITGEGEATFVNVVEQLSQGASLEGVEGVALVRNRVFQSLPRRPSGDPGHFPSPYLAQILAPGEGEGVLWELSRGCSFACDFCFDHKGDAGVRSFPLERIEAELRLFVRRKVSQVFVLDSTFNRNGKRAKDILRLIQRIAPHIHFHFEVRSEFIDAEMATLFAEITCSLQIGLQSADPLVLRNVGRAFNREDFCDRIAMLNQTGAVFGFDLIYGLPGDSLAGFRQSVDYALSLYPNHLDIFPLAVLPGTRLAERANEFGLVHHTSSPYTLISSPGFSPADMGIAGRLAAACDIFYSRGKAVAWFNAVLQALHLRPSLLLDHFGQWLAEQNTAASEEQLDDRRIWQMQRSFLEQLFKEKGRQKLIPLAHDLVDYHYYYACALLSPQPDLPTDRELERTDLLRARLSISPAAFLAHFNYEIVDVLEAGEPDLREFARYFKPNKSFAVIYPRGGEVFTESLVEPYYRLLQDLGTGKTAEISVRRHGIDPEEALSFLEFAAAEGIITLPAVVKATIPQVPPWQRSV